MIHLAPLRLVFAAAAALYTSCSRPYDPAPASAPVPAEPAMAAKLPASMRVCETHRVRICGVWTLEEGGHYAARWDDGATAAIRVVRFTAEEMEVRRVDFGQNRDFTGEYRGTVRGRTAAGVVTWNAAGEPRAGTWTAEW